jgi:hypothetical protein
LDATTETSDNLILNLQNLLLLVIRRKADDHDNHPYAALLNRKHYNQPEVTDAFDIKYEYLSNVTRKSLKVDLDVKIWTKPWFPMKRLPHQNKRLLRQN